MYEVFEGSSNKKEHPAKYPAGPKIWHTSRFASFIEALNYTHYWLGQYSPGRILKLNEPHYYSGYGDYVVIRKDTK